MQGHDRGLAAFDGDDDDGYDAFDGGPPGAAASAARRPERSPEPSRVEQRVRPAAPEGRPVREVAAPAVIQASSLDYCAALTELNFTDIDLSVEDPGRQARMQVPMTFSKYFEVDPKYRPSWTALARVLAEDPRERGRVFFQDMPLRFQKTRSTDGHIVFVRRLHPTIRTLEQLRVDPGAIRMMGGWHTAERGGGLILFCGKTGQGKTTTAGALVSLILSTVGGKAYTVEEPPEMALAGDYRNAKGEFVGHCYQHEVFEKDWDTPLENALRSKPDIVYLGEILTPEVAYEAVSMANTGHLVISTVHGGTPGEALGRLIKKATSHTSSGGIDSVRYDLSYCLRAIVHQSLGPGGPYLEVVAPEGEARISEFRTAIQVGNVNALRGGWSQKFTPTGAGYQPGR